MKYLNYVGVSIALFTSMFVGSASVETEASMPVARELSAQPLPTACTKEARATVKLRADEGDKMAQFLMGLRFFRGVCESPREGDDEKEAVYYLSKSAAQFHPPSMYLLTLTHGYLEGKHEEDALRLLRGAAERGFRKAEWDVGRHYAFGKKSIRNNPEAYAWLSLAALHDPAFRDMIDPQITEVKARMSKRDMAKAEQLKDQLLEKMKLVPKYSDDLCCGSGGGEPRRE
ncbi:MAG: hypothetical protein ABI171_16785 [Collimonas sp.]|uniref:tetratricopeptide repeat protein n=1 Tax=Collimonas sp. TaxID=1963772 RepID=UPI0032642AF4